MLGINCLIGDYMQLNGFSLHGETGGEEALLKQIALAFKLKETLRVHHEFD